MEKGPEIKKVKYEAEPTRHYPRFKIPAYIEIDGKRYKLKDWSLGGCAIIDLPEKYLERKWGTGNLIVPFDTFDAVIKDLKLEFLRKNPDGTVGCRFTELRPEQISLMQDIIEAYLEGSIVSLDEFINVIKREDLREALEKSRPNPPESNRVEEWVRRLFIFSLFFIIAATLTLFLLDALYTRVFQVKAVSAFVDSRLEIIRTPASGIFQSKSPWKKGEEIRKGTVLGTVRAINGFPILIKSPVSGKLYKSLVKEYDLVREGDPLFQVLPKGEKLYITANILHKDTERLRIGEEAVIVFPSGEIVKGRVIKIETPISLSALHQTTPMPAYAYATNYDRVRISLPDNFKDIRLIGTSVNVIFDLTPSYLKPLFKPFARY